jgi:hypothetical protein
MLGPDDDKELSLDDGDDGGDGDSKGDSKGDSNESSGGGLADWQNDPDTLDAAEGVDLSKGPVGAMIDGAEKGAEAAAAGNEKASPTSEPHHHMRDD